jgi:hypothetical protein
VSEVTVVEGEVVGFVGAGEGSSTRGVEGRVGLVEGGGLLVDVRGSLEVREEGRAFPRPARPLLVPLRPPPPRPCLERVERDERATEVDVRDEERDMRSEVVERLPDFEEGEGGMVVGGREAVVEALGSLERPGTLVGTASVEKLWRRGMVEENSACKRGRSRVTFSWGTGQARGGVGGVGGVIGRKGLGEEGERWRR